MRHHFSHLLPKIDSGEAIHKIQAHLESESRAALVIYACDARTLTLYGEGDHYITQSYQEANIILPDGRPVYWLSKWWLKKSFTQLTGPGLFAAVLSSDELRLKRHMFYGGSERTVSTLMAKCREQGVNVVHAESPPFLPIDKLEVGKVNKMIKHHNPDFFWCGLGAPKQEFLLYQLERENNVVMVGVGLAFDYYSGTVRKAPNFISKLGLEWVMRYGQQPQRIGRFIKPLFYVGRLLVMEIIRVRFQSARQG
ncbi:MAG: WecB/TagA/CpsF family glycosyltransferase [Flavobacteriales bacterium]